MRTTARFAMAMTIAMALSSSIRTPWRSTLRAAAVGVRAASTADHDYSHVFSKARDEGIAFADLPGFTRSAFERDHALITPESRVWSSIPGWTGASTAHLVTPAFPMGAEFSMYLVQMKPGGALDSAAAAAPQLERFVFVTEGAVEISGVDGTDTLRSDDFAYFPPSYAHKITSAEGAGLVVYERMHVDGDTSPSFVKGSTSDKPILPVPGEIFKLRKCLPEDEAYDFNIHIMDFEVSERDREWASPRHPIRSDPIRSRHSVIHHRIPLTLLYLVPVCVKRNQPFLTRSCVRACARACLRVCVCVIMNLGGRVPECEGGPLQPARLALAGGPRHLPPRGQVVSRAGRRCDLDGTFRAPVVWCPRKNALTIHPLQGHVQSARNLREVSA